MRLLFSKEKSVNEITSKFRRCFPCLKLRFFVQATLPGQPAFAELPAFTRLKNILELNEPVVIEFEPSVSVAAFEKQVLEKTGLFARIFRMRHNKWVEIKHTEDSIEDFNEMSTASETNSYNYYTLFL